MYRQWPCGAFAALEKRAKYAAAGSSEVSCKRRRQLCLNVFKTFLLLVSQRLLSPVARAGCLAPALLCEASSLSVKVFLTHSAEEV